MQYLFLPAGGIDAGQAGRLEEATLMQPDADEVGRTVGGGAHQQTAGGDAVVHLQQAKLRTLSNTLVREFYSS